MRLLAEKGQSALELALVLPALLLIVAALLQTGVYFYREITLNDAVRAAGRAAITCRVSPNPAKQPSQVGNDAANGLSIDWVAGGTCPAGLHSGDTLTVSGNASMGNLGFPILEGIFPTTDTKSVQVVAE